MALFDDWTWPWETGQVVNDLADSIAAIVFGGIIGVLGILILTGKVPLPGGLPARLIIGLGAVAGAGLLIMGVRIW